MPDVEQAGHAARIGGLFRDICWRSGSRCFHESLHSGLLGGHEFMLAEDLARCSPENIAETCRSNQHRGFGECEPSSFPLGSLRPFAKLSFDSEQEHRHLVYCHFTRIPWLLVPVEAERFVANDGADQACFFICLACRCRGSREIADGPTFGNDPGSPTSGRDEQNPYPTIFAKREW
jgi:hypothetical protein